MPVQSAFHSVQHRDWVLFGESLGSLMLCMTVQSLHLVKRVLCSRCREFTKSLPSFMGSSYSSYFFPFNSPFLQNLLYPFFPSLSGIFLWISSPVL